MKKLFLISSLLLSMTMVFSQSSYLAVWERTDSSGNTEYLEFDSDSMYIYTYSSPSSCYLKSSYVCVDLGNGVLQVTVSGSNANMPYSIDSTSTITIDNFMNSSQQFSFNFSNTSISSLNICGSPVSNNHLGQWTNTDTTFLEITSDTIFIYEFDFGCYNTLTFPYVNQGGGVLYLNVAGQGVPASYTLSNNNQTITLIIDVDTLVFDSNSFDLSLYNPCPSAWACDVLSGACVENSFGQFDTEAECIAACSNTGGNSNAPYIGQWRSDDTTTLVEITSDTIFIYEFEEEDCYEATALSYLDTGNDTIVISTPAGNLPATYSLQNNNSIFNIYSMADTNVFYSFTFDITQYEACEDDSSASGNGYLGQWKTSDSTFKYVHITSDSILLYQFDSTDCYTYSSMIYSDIGNNQLQVATIITSNYTLSSNVDSMTLSITGIGNYEMVRDSFDVSSWVKCTYNWKCNPTGCEDVGLNNGTFHSESDCQATCTDTKSIPEYELNVSIYPNPFSEYTTLSLSPNVIRYQLIDLTGRLVFNKAVENQVEYLHKNQLNPGVYLLHLIGNRGSGFERLLIE